MKFLKTLIKAGSLLTSILILASCSASGSMPTAYVPSDIRALAEIQARAAGIPVRLVQAVIAVESAGNPYAVSRTGARGLMQLMPATATRYGVINTFDANENVRGGCAYLRDLLQRYHGNAVLATAAYNAGEGAVDAYHGIPPFPETTEYVKRLQASGAF